MEFCPSLLKTEGTRSLHLVPFGLTDEKFPPGSLIWLMGVFFFKIKGHEKLKSREVMGFKLTRGRLI